MKEQIKIIFTDDKPEWRVPVAQALQEFGILTLAHALNGSELLLLLKTHHPDVILLDLRMPIMDGSATLNYLNSLYPDLKVIILTFHNEKILIDDFVDRGIDGFITKDEISGDIELLAKLINKVYRGRKHITINKANIDLKFTEVQKDIAQMEGLGLSKKEIQAKTGLTERAVTKQRRRIMDKFGVSTLSAFYKYLAIAGLEFLRTPTSKNDPDKKLE